MRSDQVFFVIKNVVTGDIIVETKAAGNPRPALYASRAAANRAMTHRVDIRYMVIENPDYVPGTVFDQEAYRLNGQTYYKEFQRIAHKIKRVVAPEGTWQIVPVTLVEVANGEG